MTAQSTGGKRPSRRPPVKPPAPPPATQAMTSPTGTRATVPVELVEHLRRRGWQLA